MRRKTPYESELELSNAIARRNRHSSYTGEWFGPDPEPEVSSGRDCNCSGCLARFYPGFVCAEPRQPVRGEVKVHSGDHWHNLNVVLASLYVFNGEEWNLATNEERELIGGRIMRMLGPNGRRG